MNDRDLPDRVRSHARDLNNGVKFRGSMGEDFEALANEALANDELTVVVAMRIPCPDCGTLHIDEGEFATKVHHTHACQECGMVWRPAVVPTVGVRFLPGYKDANRGSG